MLCWTLWSSVLRKQLHCFRLGRYFLFADRQTDRQEQQRAAQILSRVPEQKSSQNPNHLPTSMCIRQFPTETVDTTEMVRFRVRFQFLWMIEEGEREEQGDLSVALVLWAQNRRFRGVWVSDEMGGVVFWWVCLVKL